MLSFVHVKNDHALVNVCVQDEKRSLHGISLMLNVMTSLFQIYKDGFTSLAAGMERKHSMICMC